MNIFINCTVNNGLSIDTFRSPNSTVTDIEDIAEALTSGREQNLVCSVDSDTLELLEDGSHWNGSDASQDALETLHDLISSY